MNVDIDRSQEHCGRANEKFSLYVEELGVFTRVKIKWVTIYPFDFANKGSNLGRILDETLLVDSAVFFRKTHAKMNIFC